MAWFLKGFALLEYSQHLKKNQKNYNLTLISCLALGIQVLEAAVVKSILVNVQTYQHSNEISLLIQLICQLLTVQSYVHDFLLHCKVYD